MLFGDGSVPQMVGQSFVGMLSDVLYMLHAGEVLSCDGHVICDARLSVLQVSPECVLSNSVYLQGVYIYYIILDVHYTLASNKKYFFNNFLV